MKDEEEEEDDQLAVHELCLMMLSLQRSGLAPTFLCFTEQQEVLQTQLGSQCSVSNDQLVSGDGV